jgi:2-polyprenyl-3-methyl-5-hydroxy-6-metoxy-1,4-benzoquinol methylase
MPTCSICGSESIKFSDKRGYSLYRCKACSFVFVHPIPDSTHVYGEDYFAGAVAGHGYVNYEGDKEPMVPTFEKYVRSIQALAPAHGRLLDVGAATGFFLEIARRFGFEVYGVEISAFAAEKASEKGIPMITGTLADVPPTPKFNVLTMLDVIEHVSDPKSELSRAHSLLEKDGVLIINTPDIGSMYARLMGKNWHLIVPPEHLFYFNRANMRLDSRENWF